jgi:hypothetical protein
VVTVHGKYIERMEVRMRAETIETIAREYRLRLGRVEELAKERDALEKGSAPWIAKHSLVLGGYERLISWLKESSFGERAETLQKEYEREAQRWPRRARACAPRRRSPRSSPPRALRRWRAPPRPSAATPTPSRSRRASTCASPT